MIHGGGERKRGHVNIVPMNPLRISGRGDGQKTYTNIPLEIGRNGMKRAIKGGERTGGSKEEERREGMERKLLNGTH